MREEKMKMKENWRQNVITHHAWKEERKWVSEVKHGHVERNNER